MKKILMIGPFPGSLNGQTIANQTIYEGLAKKYRIDRINTLKEEGFEDKSQQGKFKIGKFTRIISQMRKEILMIFNGNYDVIYMTSGQSYLGFMRFSPYMLASTIKKVPYYNHIHGGFFRKMYNSQSKLKQKIINFFLNKSTGMIVLGDSLRSMFQGIIPENKIFVCENGVQDEFIATEDEINEKIKKYSRDDKKRVLYLSNLMEEKGILDLLKVSEKFSDEEIEFNLAGAIEPSLEKIVKEYLEKYPNKIKYHGIARGKQKKKLLFENYIFILPTYYSNEGQPISILEAYTNGCSVITDESIGGIRDIFCDNKNGLSCQNRSIKSIYDVIKNINEKEYMKMNYDYGKEKFSNDNFTGRIVKIILGDLNE
ncbi:glycosyltransferase family 4 protein [Cetobacterium sp. 2A]|uniref:glycosyltransferase family 4 protein n=1 Tax=Cetobacterium sp. 2A TaxID=2754723 RepID=UPI00163B7138|nr:glycosyltransferase family 4 protein [Cetobacterium sp. 2A]MBC2856174.1 glycosyltransferase family 4 protein [Cetobacterium sp. 2A]